MGIQQVAMFVVVLAAFGAYWWFKFGRHGGAAGYMNRRLGLREGEQVAAMWTAYYDIDRTTGQKLGELAGVRTRGVNVMVAITSQHRLSIGNNELDVPATIFERGQVMISEYSQQAEIGSIAGTNGLEPAHVMLLTPAQGAPFRLQLARSGLQAIQAWSLGHG